MRIYCIKNESTGFFNRPMFCESDNEVISLIQNNIASDPSKALFNLAECLALYYCGDVDFTTFKVSQPRHLIKIGTLSDFCKNIKFKEVKYVDTDNDTEDIDKA